MEWEYRIFEVLKNNKNLSQESKDKLRLKFKNILYF